MQRRTFLKGLGALTATLTAFGCGGSDVVGSSSPGAPAPVTPSTSELAVRRLIFGPDSSRLELNPITRRVRLVGPDGALMFEQTGLDQWNFPLDGSVGDDGLLYVLDTGNARIQVLDSTGAVLRTLVTPALPSGVAEAAGRVYVSDGLGHRVLILDILGAQLGSFGALGTGDGQFNYPAGIAIDPQGNVHVCDAGNFRVQVFTPDGVFVRKYGVGSGLNFPQSIAIDPAGNSYVGDINDREVQVFDATGASLPSFPLPSTNNPLEPVFVSLSPDQVLFVTDSEA